MEKPAILRTVRAPIGKFMGELSPLTAPEPGAKYPASNTRVYKTEQTEPTRLTTMKIACGQSGVLS
jgi:hypothetical protein